MNLAADELSCMPTCFVALCDGVTLVLKNSVISSHKKCSHLPNFPTFPTFSTFPTFPVHRRPRPQAAAQSSATKGLPLLLLVLLVFLIDHAGILQNLGSNMGQKSILNQLLKPFRGLGSVRNGFAMYFSSRLSLSKL